ncbi:MAG: TetR/AcrR family transcriptional regulator [Aliishimia sp.]
MQDTDQSLRRKQEILKGAFSALIKNGLPSLSFDVIAKEAGLSRQLVRYHFPDDEALMIALCDFLAAQYRDALIAKVMKTEGKDRLEIFLDYYFDLLEDMPKPRDDQVYDALMSLSAGSQKIRDTLRENYSFLGQVISHEFELQFPSLGSRESKELSYLFVCLMYGHWKMVASLGLSEDHKHITRQAMDRLIQSYVSKSVPLGNLVATWQQEGAN